MFRFLILGSGPAGLTFANLLLQAGIDNFIVLEKEKAVGGLCRSIDVDGAPLDVGGGHFLDTRRPKINEFLFRFMAQSEWDLYERDSRIHINGSTISHPMEANIWQMALDEQVKYLKSIAAAGCNTGKSMPKKFVDWIYWKLGERIAADYMIPYNRKIFGDDLDSLGTYWLEKLPNVSFEETLLSCLTHKPYGTQPGHAQFYYPKKYGYGELWQRMGESLGDRLMLGAQVSIIDFDSRIIILTDGSRYCADTIISTIPWAEFSELRGMPKDLTADIKRLKHTGVQIEYYPQSMDTQAQWLYYPDSLLSYHRILVRQTFCPGSRGYWTETNASRADIAHDPGAFRYMNKYAYPLNTIEKPIILRKLLTWTKGKNVYGLGRWGEHEHYNSDITVERAMALVNEFLFEQEAQ